MGANISIRGISDVTNKVVTNVIKNNTFNCHNTSELNNVINIGERCCPGLTYIGGVEVKSFITANSACDVEFADITKVREEIKNDLTRELQQLPNVGTLNLDRTFWNKVYNSVDKNITQELLIDCVNATIASTTINIMNTNMNQCSTNLLKVDFKDGKSVVLDNPIINGSWIHWSKIKNWENFDHIQDKTIDTLIDFCDSDDLILNYNNYIKYLSSNMSFKDFKNIKEFKGYIKNYDKLTTMTDDQYRRQIIILYLLNQKTQTIILPSRSFDNIYNNKIIQGFLKKNRINMANIKGLGISSFTYEKCQPICNPAIQMIPCPLIIKDLKIESLSDAFLTTSNKIQTLTDATTDIATTIVDDTTQKGANLIFVILAIVFLLIIIIAGFIIYNKYKNKNEFIYSSDIFGTI